MSLNVVHVDGFQWSVVVVVVVVVIFEFLMFESCYT